jgi:gluconate kinase
MIDEERVILEVARKASKRSLFGVDNIPLNDDFAIQLRRDWEDNLEDVTAKFTVVLFCRSAYKGDRDIIVMKSENMLELLSIVSRYIEDAKRATFDQTTFRWIL